MQRSLGAVRMRAIQSRIDITPILVVLAALFGALLLGLLAAFGNVLISLVFAAGLIGLFMMMRPDLMLWMLTLIVLVLSGALQTFADIHQLQWGASILGVALIVRAAIEMASINRGFPIAQSSLSLKAQTNYIGIFAVLFVLVLVTSTAINTPPLQQLIVGFRIYVPFWGVFLILSYGKLEPRLLKKLVLGFLAIAVIQAPVALYQKLVIVPERLEGRYFGSAWDSIVGTFGGGKFGGGASGSMAVFLVCMCLVAASLWKNGELKTRWFLLVFLSSMVAVGLAEAKVIFVILPIGMLLLFKDRLFKSPVKFILGSLSTLGIMVAILYSYYVFYWATETRGNIYDAIVRRFAYSFDPNFMASLDWPGRFTGLFIWARNHDFMIEPDTTLLGHGVAAATSYSTLMGPSREALRYGLGLEVSGTTKLLWDSGLLGFIFFVCMFIAAYFVAIRTSKRTKTPPWHSAVLQGIAASMPILVAVLFYEVTAVSSPSIQMLSMFFFGYIVYWNKFSGFGRQTA